MHQQTCTFKETMRKKKQRRECKPFECQEIDTLKLRYWGHKPTSETINRLPGTGENERCRYRHASVDVLRRRPFLANARPATILAPDWCSLVARSLGRRVLWSNALTHTYPFLKQHWISSCDMSLKMLVTEVPK